MLGCQPHQPLDAAGSRIAASTPHRPLIDPSSTPHFFLTTGQILNFFEFFF
jgi:hypothetical protein